MNMCFPKFGFAAIGIVAFFSLGIPAHAQLRIVSWNSSGNTGSDMTAVLQAMGQEQRAGIAKPIDVLMLQESDGAGVTGQAYVNMLNGIYGAGTYAHGSVNGASTGAGTQSIVYRTSSVQLISETVVGTTDSNGAARQEVRHQIRPVGYGSAADLYLYNGHYKSANTTADATRRNVEAQAVRASSDALGQGANIVYAGDFNIYRSSEAMWGTLTGSGNGQAFDPLNAVDGRDSIGSWTGNAAYRAFHTQSPVVNQGQNFPGQTGGGMDDRFDFQLVSGELTDGEGMSYIANTYRAFGNTDTHTLNGNLTSGSAAAFAALFPGYTTAQAQTLLAQVANVCDHLPIIADYQLPSVMGVSLTTTPTTVIAGANVSVVATVSNTANVITVNGADELDFSVTGTGALSGGGTGTDNALGGGIDRTLTLNTATAGAKSGSVDVSSSSEAVANGTFSQNVSVNVLDHANASFSSLADQDQLTINFGIVGIGGTLTQNFSLSNLIATNGFTAGLDLDSIIGSGDTGVFGTSLSTFFNQLAGTSSGPFAANFATGTAGNFAATYTLNFSDQDLPGAGAIGSLKLNLVGVVAPVVVPEAGTAELVGLGCSLLGMVAFTARRRA